MKLYNTLTRKIEKFIPNKKNEVKNIDLWQQLDEIIKNHEIRWVWVKGHNGHTENERVDTLARNEVTKLKK